MNIVKSLGLFKNVSKDFLTKSINKSFDIKFKFEISKAIKMQNNLTKQIK